MKKKKKIQKLLERNYQVKVLVRNVENAKKMFPQSEIQFARADLTEKQSLEEVTPLFKILFLNFLK